MKKMNYFIPSWVISWPMILITVGLYTGFKHRFANSSWWILCLIGGLFLMDKAIPGLSFSRYIWPVALIIVGLWLVFGKHKHHFHHKDHFSGYQKSGLSKEQTEESSSSSTLHDNSDFIESVCIFGGAQRLSDSKNFRGGDIVSIISGTEINLKDADFQGTAVIELTTIMGGSSLIIPSDWTLKSELVTIFGGIEDKRFTSAQKSGPEKILVLKGTIVFGGIEVKSI